MGCAGAMCTEGCDVVGAHRSKERLSAPAQRGRAGLVVVSLQGQRHGSGKNWPIRSTVEAHARGSDGSKSSSQLTPAAWPVRPDPLPSQGGFGAPG